jgi:replicative DNA helicase
MTQLLWDAHAELSLGIPGPGVLAAERAVLGCLLTDCGLATVVARVALRVSHFGDMRHRTIFYAMLEREVKALPYDLILIVADLEETGRLKSVGGAEYVASLTDNIPSVDCVLAYARVVVDGALARRIAATKAPR